MMFFAFKYGLTKINLHSILNKGRIIIPYIIGS